MNRYSIFILSVLLSFSSYIGIQPMEQQKLLTQPTSYQATKTQKKDASIAASDSDDDEEVNEKKKLSLGAQVSILIATGAPAIASSYVMPQSMLNYYLASVFGGSSKTFLRNFGPLPKYTALSLLCAAGYTVDHYVAKNFDGLSLNLGNLSAVLIAAALKRDVKNVMLGKKEKKDKKKEKNKTVAEVSLV